MDYECICGHMWHDDIKPGYCPECTSVVIRPVVTLEMECDNLRARIAALEAAGDGLYAELVDVWPDGTRDEHVAAWRKLREAK